MKSSGQFSKGSSSISSSTMTPRRIVVAVIYFITLALWGLSITYLSPAVPQLPPPPPPWRHHAFLNFRGLDVRHAFSDHLYSALRRSGVRAYRDDKDMPRGANITEELLKAIEGSMISVVLLSSNYASSSSCLDELVTIMRCRHKMAHLPLPVFYLVSPEDVQDQSGPFKRDFDKHKDQYTYNRVDSWIRSMQDVADLAGWELKRHSSEAETVERIVNQVVEAIHSSTKEKKHPPAKNHVAAPAASPPAGGKVDAASMRRLLNTEFVRELEIKRAAVCRSTTLEKAYYSRR
ncbi:unnamed protein product [Linum trigynum]|uniref:TIR domain-containing protein n=1 Tax=Linum trigynum TaxID=586398 RepID=A0AAV2DUV2_9ROSI